MPPQNTRAASPSFLSALREFEHPVNDDVLRLADTLTTTTTTTTTDNAYPNDGATTYAHDDGDGDDERGVLMDLDYDVEATDVEEEGEGEGEADRAGAQRAYLRTATHFSPADGQPAMPASPNTSTWYPTAAYSYASAPYAPAYPDPDLARARARERERERERAELDQLRSQRQRLRNMMNRLSRLHDAPTPHPQDTPSEAVEAGPETDPYGDRVPRSNRLYDWSPANNEAGNEIDELNDILADIRAEIHGSNSQDDNANANQNSGPNANLDLRLSGTGMDQLYNNSLRTHAIMHSIQSSARRHLRFNSRTRDYLSRWHSERRAGSGSRSPHRSASNTAQTPPFMHARDADLWNRGESLIRGARDLEHRQQAFQRLIDRRATLERERERQVERQRERERADVYRQRDRDRDIMARVESLRRSYLNGSHLREQEWSRDHTSPMLGMQSPPAAEATSVSPMLEQTIQYLARVRHSSSAEVSHAMARDLGLLPDFDVSEENQNWHEVLKDFITDLDVLPHLCESSWLAPGAVLEGYQHATTITTLCQSEAELSPAPRRTTFRFRNGDSMTSTFLGPSTGAGAPGRSSRRPYLSAAGMLSTGTAEGMGMGIMMHSPQQDRWPVKVTIHEVDYAHMRLAATMEAYNVPSHPQFAGPRVGEGVSSGGDTRAGGNGAAPTLPPIPQLSSLLTPSPSSASASGNNSFDARIASGGHLLNPNANANANTTEPTPPASSSSQLPSSSSQPPPAPAPTASITTFLEAEILDFRHFHTLLTSSFKSTPANDALYWRKLPCFADYTDTELALNLLSRKWVTEELLGKWICMRWKEQCFVRPSSSPSTSSSSTSLNSDSIHPPHHLSRSPPVPASSPNNIRIPHGTGAGLGGETGGGVEVMTFGDAGTCGLTISGFYYVCLRRGDGGVEGLYCDPQSSPYQCLRLESVRGGSKGRGDLNGGEGGGGGGGGGGATFPAWSFA